MTRWDFVAGHTEAIWWFVALVFFGLVQIIRAWRGDPRL
jgi:hypothetical protein